MAIADDDLPAIQQMRLVQIWMFVPSAPQVVVVILRGIQIGHQE